MTFARGVVDGGPGVGLVEKPTKTGQIWKVALAPGTAKRLEEFRSVCEERAEAVRVELPADAFVFAVPADGSRPWRPDNVTARWRRLRTKVGLDGCRLHDYADIRVMPTRARVRWSAGVARHLVSA